MPAVLRGIKVINNWAGTNYLYIMQISQIIQELERFAPGSYQESYDNAGLLCGEAIWQCSGVVVALDATEAVIEEAVMKGCNLVVAHHPIVFSGLKKITGKNYVEKTLIRAIKNNVAIFAIHTNLDNVMEGVNGKIASLLGLVNQAVLLPKAGMLKKMYCFVPDGHLDAVRDALFAAGGGQIGQYSECSFEAQGRGTFKPGEGTMPFSGTYGVRHNASEIRLELIYPAYLETALVRALKQSHPYEEVAFDLVQLTNEHPRVGSGICGNLPEEMAENDFLELLKSIFKVPVVKHSPLLGRPVKKVALCGGAGSFMVSRALQLKVDAYITADMKYHEYFDANGSLLIADVGHFESEQFTVDLLYDILAKKFPTFAVFKTGVLTNPVNYYI
ncbi:Nif3-like dinuclear metal center hexameric protein [Flavihumibacter profundi]|uniref:Nif3-like dinuclear metal center hexameric protein n=1 Tax=Flavihumibacter profundi TaxID=2716883 RepID=UPI001CC5DD1A|nr:Nif3-like dinuclear metal center hexameric protein [Flavihumibacter profundi]MBZ5859248.1 Nif3-like dinuclear metal center hexameric protein [Flavihumibacter profundi]